MGQNQELTRPLVSARPRTADSEFAVSIVIVSWNTRQVLEECLSSVFASLQTVSAEVWVVDNASSDGSAAMVRTAYPQVKLLANDENLGFARANNQALRQANGRYLLLLNSDTLVPPGAIDALTQAMDTRPEVSVCGPLLLNADGSPQINWARFPNLNFELSGQLDRSQSPYPLDDFPDADKRRAMRPFPVDWVGGACLMVRRDRALTVGYLDEGYFMYSEETDWCRRFVTAGGTVLLVPSVTVTHLGGQSSRAVPRETRKRMWRSSLRFYQKSYGTLGGLSASALATLRYLLSPLRQFKPTEKAAE